MKLEALERNSQVLRVKVKELEQNCNAIRESYDDLSVLNYKNENEKQELILTMAEMERILLQEDDLIDNVCDVNHIRTGKDGSVSYNENASDALPSNSPPDVDGAMKSLIVREQLELLRNGTETYWLIGDSELRAGYMVQVQARNRYGLQQSRQAEDGRREPRAERRAAPARLRAGDGVHCPTDAEISNLPHIRREQIRLTKFLGSGAFGEVFEGIAGQINGATLRKGATALEKIDFLKEAVLMSNFKHEHILRLLGVCLDADSDYIIMELMEGGDLLSYLRAKRASLVSLTCSAISGLREPHWAKRASLVSLTCSAISGLREPHCLTDEFDSVRFIEHILRLLGVCLDADSDYIIMELMEKIRGSKTIC
ncbi:Tyrosine-protein kinase receptor [Operophtera brumata]|uniref:Tyrosine-protein kinase receptor n=1 Tax=Operophtera brumata TaxID=104452 RepID=A0A0L7KPC7_OPEBR|nr:Tyrosine-protein kinase receptor [Operophtera brumata]